MKSLLLVLALALLSVPSIGIAKDDGLTDPPYVYCNVYLSAACFGIGPGDSLTMSIPADFVIYEVSFAFGRKAIVYSGNHPDVSPSGLATFQPCGAENGFSECKSRSLADGGEEMLALADKNGPYVHIRVSGGKGNERAIRSFLDNVRSCTGTAKGITCSR